MKQLTKIEMIQIDLLSPAKYNPRTITDKAKKGLTKSITEFGLVQLIVVNEREFDETGSYTVVSGHQRLDILLSRGFTETECVVVNLSEKKEKKLNILMNSQKISGDWLQDELEAMLAEFADDDDYFDYNFDELIIDQAGKAKEVLPLEKSEELEISNKPPIVQLGDIFEFKINNKIYKLACGDSTDIDLIKNLSSSLNIDCVLTDPPYGVDITKNKKSSTSGVLGALPEIAGDKDTSVAREHYHTCSALELKKMIIFGGNYFTDFLPPSRCWLIWDKKVAKGMSFARGEIAWTSFDKNMDIYEIAWTGNLHGKVDLGVEGLEKEVLNGSSRVKRTHPTQKPVSLFNQIILDFDFETYFDGFNGGGTTFMSCIQNKKNYIGVEILPVYVEATLRRVHKYLEANQIKYEYQNNRDVKLETILNNI
jgi:hypothetical protein